MQQSPFSGKQYYRLPDKNNRTNRFDPPKNSAILSAVTVTAPSKTDPLGMYTGVPDDPFDTPVQAADDL